MTVDHFGDDLGLCMYTFKQCTFKDVARYLIEHHGVFSGKYKITGIHWEKKYWFFGPLTVKIVCETEEAIQRYGGNGEEPKYKIFIS